MRTGAVVARARRCAGHNRCGRGLNEPDDGGKGPDRCAVSGTHGAHQQETGKQAGDDGHDARVLHHRRPTLTHQPVTPAICAASSTNITPSTSSNAPGTITSATTS